MVPTGIVESEKKSESVNLLVTSFIDFEKEFMWNTLNILHKRLIINPKSTSWRVNAKHYRSPTECKYKPGSLSFGLAWYQQAMKVVI